MDDGRLEDIIAADRSYPSPVHMGGIGPEDKGLPLMAHLVACQFISNPQPATYLLRDQFLPKEKKSKKTILWRAK